MSEDIGCRHLQGTKIYGKSSLKYVPLIGWAWMFTESIFLRRDWDQDKQTISRDLTRIRDYPDGYWVTVSDFTVAASLLHTHSRFTALLEFVRDHPGEQVPEK